MTLRMPKDLQEGLQTTTGAIVLDAELLAEKAASLANAGRDVETAVSSLRDASRDSPDYQARLRAAADAVYRYFVQRELNGVTDHRDVIVQYAIGADVIARLGQSDASQDLRAFDGKAFDEDRTPKDAGR